MRCPNCNVDGETRSLETRSRLDGTTRRRRRCLSCEQLFSTIEVPITGRMGGPLHILAVRPAVLEGLLAELVAARIATTEDE